MKKRVASIIISLMCATNGVMPAFADNNINDSEFAEDNINETVQISLNDDFQELSTDSEEENKTDNANDESDFESKSDEPENNDDSVEIHIPYNELVEKLYTVKYDISDGLTYTRNILNHESHGTEREYVLEYNPESETEIAFLTNEYLYKTDMIRNMASYTYPEKNFVAGINADFFNMSTGVPESAYIKDYELYTTDRDSFCLAQTEDNKYFFDKPQIKLKMFSEDQTEYHIVHLNKEFSEYGLYMYNSRYSDKTHIKNDYTAAVLYPYTEKLTLEQIKKLVNKSSLSSKIKTLDRIEDKDSEKAIELKSEVYKLAEELSGYKVIGDNFYLISEVKPRIGQTEKLVVKEVINENSNSVIPENAYLVCADNTTYGYVLRQLSEGDTFTFVVEGNESFYDVKNAIGTGAVILKDSETIDDRALSHYTSLQPRSAVGIKEDGTLVFYAVDGRRKGHSSGMKLLELAEQMKNLGCTYAANFDGGGSTAVNASLPGYDTADTVNIPSQTKERKISNAVGFFNNMEKTATPASAYAYGDYYYTLNDWHISLGQIVVSDENGFSIIKEPDNEILSKDQDYDGDDIAEQERDDNKEESKDKLESDSVIEDEPDDEVQGEEKIEIFVPENVNLYIKDGAGFVADGTVYPAGHVGSIDVYAAVDGTENENIAATVVSIEAPDEIKLSVEKNIFAPFEKIGIAFESLYRKLSVASGFTNFDWTVMPVIEKEERLQENETDENDSAKDIDSKEVQSVNEAETGNDQTQKENTEIEITKEQDIVYGTFDNGFFIPSVKGMKLELIASRGDAFDSIIVDIDDYPFADMEGHWAVKEIYQLAKNGIVKGQYDEEGIAFYLPERNYSRYEFCVMVERISGIGSDIDVPPYKIDSDSEDELEEVIVSNEQESNISEPESELNTKEPEFEYSINELFDAETIPEWAYESVFRLYVSGLLDEIIHTDENNNKVFNGDMYITRAEVMKVLGKICENAPDDITLDEYYDLTEEQKNDIHIKNVVHAGLFSGYEDMSLRPHNNLTRAEAAAVFSRFYNL